MQENTNTTAEPVEVGGIAADRLRSLIQRIEHLEEETKSLGSDIKDIYAEAKSAGFDAKVRRLVSAAMTGMAAASAPPAAKKEPREATSEERIKIRAALDRHFDDAKGAYLDRKTDETIGAELNIQCSRRPMT